MRYAMKPQAVQADVPHWVFDASLNCCAVLFEAACRKLKVTPCTPSPAVLLQCGRAAYNDSAPMVQATSLSLQGPCLTLVHVFLMSPVHLNAVLHVLLPLL